MKIFAEIVKVDPDKRMVYGYASTEALDSQGERVAKEAIEEALPDYMKFANIREMHQPSAVGVAKEATIDEKGLYLAAKVVDDAAWTKVKEGVYKGFSIGGKKELKKDDTITRLKLSEISLVDRPANPEAVFTMFKAEDAEKREFTQEERDKASDEGQALPDGSFPIKSRQDLKNAIKAYGRAKDKEAAKKHIISRAKDLGATDLLPADWEGSTKEKAATAEDLKKWAGEEIWDAGIAAQALDSINSLYQKEKTEEHAESGSQIADLEAVIQRLKSFIASEIQENDPDEDEAAAAMGLAEKTGDLAKAGARHSKADMEHVQAIHDHAAGLGAECKGAEKAGADGDMRKIKSAESHLVALAKVMEDAELWKNGESLVEKVQTATAELKKMAGENETLRKRVKELEAKPAPAKGALKAVEKGQDIGGTVEKKEEPSITAGEAIKKIHGSGGKPFTKFIGG